MQPRKRPQFHDQSGAFAKTSRTLWRNLNATKSLNEDFAAARKFCIISDAPHDGTLGLAYPICQSLAHVEASPSNRTPKTRSVPGKLVVALPPLVKNSWEEFYSHRVRSPVFMFTMTVEFFFWIFFMTWWTSFYDASVPRLLDTFAFQHSGARRRLWSVWFLLVIAVPITIGVLYRTRDLAVWLEKDALLDMCLTGKVSFITLKQQRNSTNRLSRCSAIILHAQGFTDL